MICSCRTEIPHKVDSIFFRLQERYEELDLGDVVTAFSINVSRHQPSTVCKRQKDNCVSIVIVICV